MNLNRYQFPDFSSLTSKDKKEYVICTMNIVRGDFIGPPHGTTPAAVITNEIKLRFFKSSKHINEKGDGPYRGSATYMFASSMTLQIWQHGTKENYCHFATFNRVVDSKTGAKDTV